MNQAHPQNPKRSSLILPAATMILCSSLAIPSLLAASQNDLYSKGSILAFIIWLLPQIFLFIKKIDKTKRHSNFWIIMSLGLSILSTITQLRVISHLAMAASITGFCGNRYSGLLTFGASIAWFPAAGWIASRFVTGGLAGWERPLFCAIISTVIYFIIRSKTRPFTQQKPIL